MHSFTFPSLSTIFTNSSPPSHINSSLAPAFGSEIDSVQL